MWLANACGSQVERILNSTPKPKRNRGNKATGKAKTDKQKESKQARKDDPIKKPALLPNDPEARKAVINKFKSKRPAYSNCRMLAKDGTELASCDIKKLNWYVSKGLAEWVDGNDDSSAQPTIQLTFEHRQDDQERPGGAFYVASRQNRCVGCGTTDHYLKYRCAPALCRKPGGAVLATQLGSLAQIAMQLHRCAGLCQTATASTSRRT